MSDPRKPVDWNSFQPSDGGGGGGSAPPAKTVSWDQFQADPDAAAPAAQGENSPSSDGAGDGPIVDPTTGMALQSRPGAFLQPGTPGFSPRPEDSTFAQNVRQDLVDYKDGVVALGKALLDSPGQTVAALGKGIPTGIAQSIIRWEDAAMNGKFWETAHDHPLQFVQDLSLPASIAFSGGAAALPKVFGTGITAMRVAKVLETGAKVADAAAIGSDPIGNLPLVAAKKMVGLAMKAALERPGTSTPHEMPINVDPDVATAPLLDRVQAQWDHAQTSILDANYPIRKLAREGEAAKVLAETGEEVSPNRFTDTPLEQSVRLFSGLEKKITQTLDTGFRAPEDPTSMLQRDSGPATQGPSLLMENGKYTQVPNELPFAPQEPISFSDTLKELGSANLQALRDYDVARRAVLDKARPPTMAGQWNWDVRRADFSNLSPESLAQTRGIDLEKARKLIVDNDPMYHRGDDAFSPDVHNAWLKMRQFSSDSMKYLQDSGMITPESRAQVEFDNPNYTPFMRANKTRVDLTPEQQRAWGINAEHVDVGLKDDGSFSVTGPGGQALKPPRQVIKRMEGSLRMIEDPITSRAIMAGRIMKEAELNGVMKEAAKLADVPNSGVRSVKAPEGAVKSLSAQDVAGAMDKAGILEQAAKGEDITASTLFMKPPEGMPPNTVRYFDKGEAKFLAFDNPDVAQSLASLRMKPDAPMDRWFTGRLTDVGRAAAVLQRAGVTLEPGFTLGLNVIRDAVGALTYSKYGFVPIYDNVRGLMKYLDKAEVYDLWARSGGMQAHMSAVDRPALRDAIDSYLHPNNHAYLKSMQSWVRHPVQVLQHLQEASEASTRLGEFNKGLQRGLKMERGETLQDAIARAKNQGIDVPKVLRDAGVASRDVSVDFAQQGADPSIRTWNAITAFQNAQLQSVDLFRRKMFEGTPIERAKLGARAALSITLPSMFLHARLAGDQEYADIPQVERDLFWHFRMPHYVPGIGGGLVRIPKPFEIGMLWGTLPVRAMEAVMGSDPNALKSIKDRLLDFQPFGVPTIVKAPLEVATGHDLFTGSNITPESVKGLKKTEQATATTSELARILSKFTEWTNERLPGSKAAPRQAMLTPIEIDHLIGSYTGTLGRMATKATNPMLRPLRGGVGEAPAAKGGMVAQVPVINRLVANPGQSSQTVSDFFDTLSGLEQINNTATSLKFDGDRGKYIQEHVQDIAAARVFRPIAENIFKLNHAKSAVETAPSLTGDQKRAQMDNIDKQVRTLAMKAMDFRRKQVGEGTQQ